MTPEIQAAAERVRKIKDDKTYFSVYGIHPTRGGMLESDKELLIDAYLALSTTTEPAEPLAYAVMHPSHDDNYRVFANQDLAELYADEHIDGDYRPEVVPLYRRETL